MVLGSHQLLDHFPALRWCPCHGTLGSGFCSGLRTDCWRSWCCSCCFCSSRVWNSLETQTVDSKLKLLFWQRPKPPRCFLLTIGSGRTQCFVRLSSEFQLQQLTRVCLTHLSVSIEMILSSCKVAFLSRITTQAVKKRTVCSLPQLTCVNYSGNFMCNYSVHLIMLFA